MSNDSRYLAYLVRLWVTPNGKSMTCRAMLVDPHSDERQGFSDLDSLFAYIRKAVERGALPVNAGAPCPTKGIGGAPMATVNWVIVVLLLAALIISLCEPILRERRTR